MSTSRIPHFFLACVTAIGCGKSGDPEALYRTSRDLWATRPGEERRFVLRIDGVDAYAPCNRSGSGSAVCSGSDEVSPSVAKAWLRHLEQIEAALDVESSAPALHARALARLAFSHDNETLVQAQKDLEDGLRLAGDPAPLIQDLSIVLRLRAEAEENPKWRIHALDKALEATTLAPSAARHFNAATLLAESGLHDGAMAAWNRAIQAERKSEWVNEARLALWRLAAPPPCRSEEKALKSCLESPCDAADFDIPCPEVLLVFGRDRLLTHWAEAIVQGRSREAATLWANLLELGHVLEARESPGVLGRLIAELKAAPAGAGPAAISFAEGKAALAEGAIDVAERRFRLSRAQASKLPALALLIDLELVRAHYNRASDYSRVRDRLLEFDGRTRDSGLPWLRGQIARFRGLVDGALGYEHASRFSYLEALELFEESGGELSTGYLYAQLAESDFYMGKADEGWAIWFRGMNGVGAALRRKVRFNLLDVATVDLVEEGLEHAGHAVAEEQVRLALDIDEENYTAQAQLRLGTALAEMGRNAEAAEAAQTAERAANRLGDRDLRARSVSDIALLKARVIPEESLHSALLLLSGTLDLHRRTGLRFYVPKIRHALAEIHLRLGERDEARKHLEAAADEMETLMARMEPDAGFLDRRQQIFDSLIRLELGPESEPASSLRAADRARFDADKERGTEAERRRSVEAAEETSCLLYYRVLPEKLVVWVRHGGGLDRSETSVDQRTLRSWTRALTRNLAGRDLAGLEDPAMRLYDLLVRPAEVCSEGEGSLLVAPDSFLYAVPFAVLRNRATGRYLIEETAYRLVPGLAWASSTGLPLEAWGHRSVLLASPRASRRRFPSLEPLLHAEDEIRSIAGAYLGSDFPRSQETGRDEFVSTLENAVLFHFAGHAVTDFFLPLRSVLVIGEGDDAVVSAAELRRLDLRNLRLAFLSSCQAMNGPISGSAGARSLARAFIDAGASAVVASVTDVDDAQTAELSIGFHRRLTAGVPASQALRAAQLDLLERSRGPDPAWAGYSLLGNELVIGKTPSPSVSSPD